MAVDPHEPGWGAEDGAAPAVLGDVSAVSGTRLRLSGRQKLLMIAGIGAIALAAIVLTHLPGGPAKTSGLNKDNGGGVGTLGIPFQAPAPKLIRATRSSPEKIS